VTPCTARTEHYNLVRSRVVPRRRAPQCHVTRHRCRDSAAAAWRQSNFSCGAERGARQIAVRNDLARSVLALPVCLLTARRRRDGAWVVARAAARGTPSGARTGRLCRTAVANDGAAQTCLSPSAAAPCALPPCVDGYGAVG
jgi:hypothetical protein